MINPVKSFLTHGPLSPRSPLVERLEQASVDVKKK